MDEKLLPHDERIIFDSNTDLIFVRPKKNAFVEFNFSAQYNLPFPCISNLKNYIGITLSPTMAYFRDNTSYNSRLYHITPAGSKDWHFTCGLQHYLEYEISDRLNLNSLLQAKLMPGSVLAAETIRRNMAQPNTRFSWQLGVGYNL